MPCTHCDGWPWFCQVVTLTPIGVAIRLMWFAIVETNGTWLDAGMMKSVLPPAVAFASNAGTGRDELRHGLVAGRGSPARPRWNRCRPPSAAAIATAAAASTAARVSMRSSSWSPPVRSASEPTRGSRIRPSMSWPDRVAVALERVAVAAAARRDQAEPVARRGLAVRELRRQLDCSPSRARG